MEANQIKVP